jgi:hypothetical protein
MRTSKEKSEFIFRLLYHKAYQSMRREFIPIDMIKIAHDPSQRSNDEQIIDEYHREGIDLVKKLIQKGLPILPILVKEIEDRDYILSMFRNNTKEKYVYVRMDGFKRLIAHVELGLETIEAFIDQTAIRGGQHHRPWIENETIGIS